LTIYFLAACMTNVCDLAKHHTRLASSYILDFVRDQLWCRHTSCTSRFSPSMGFLNPRSVRVATRG
jgi:hypothetical protein